LRPADRFSEFPVADHVDAGFGLAANDGGDGFGQTLLIRFPLERPARLLRAQKRLQRLWPDQAADMRGENAVSAAFHVPLFHCSASTRGRRWRPIALVERKLVI
jgi:hypothetical protein